ncbi:MAG: helix-turn-helix transcriptional regulator [Ruminococcus sp.]|nr:helix-turn-helix transcriptional regulator [Ruminococcus sp.]MBR1863817.1 helix-turn-helix transcriptional regulator [Ruminococcus sp.]
MVYPYSETGSRIWKLRKERGLTREKLAEMADISVQFLADIEKGRKNMTVTTLRKLSSALMVTTDYIVNGTINDENTLIDLCKSIPNSKQRQAAKLIRVFIESIE